MPLLQAMKSDVNDAGEVHAVIEEHDDELEIRKGQVEWHLGDGYFCVATATDEVMVHADRVVSYYVPSEIWH